MPIVPLRMRLFRPLLVGAFLLASTSPAYADFTFFIGSNQTPENRSLRGFALSGSGMITFEFEYAGHGDDVEEGTPGLRTFLFNGMVQTPFAVFGFQPYATAGAGMYRESFDERTETAWSFNSGVGVKTNNFGPIKLRVDYRVLKLSGEPLYDNVHRIYSGVHINF